RRSPKRKSRSDTRWSRAAAGCGVRPPAGTAARRNSSGRGSKHVAEVRCDPEEELPFAAAVHAADEIEAQLVPEAGDTDACAGPDPIRRGQRFDGIRA